MMIPEKRPQSAVNLDSLTTTEEAGCLYALITDKRSVSRRNRTSWYLGLLNKLVKCNPTESFDDVEIPDTSVDPTTSENENPTPKPGTDINLISLTAQDNSNPINNRFDSRTEGKQHLVTPATRVIYLSKSIATSIVLDLSPSVVSVSSQNECVFLDSMFDALKRVLHLLVKAHEIPSSTESHPFVLAPKVFISVIAYTPFIVTKNNQVLVQNRRVSMHNIDQVLVEIWLCLNKLTQEIHELVASTCGSNMDFDIAKNFNVFVFPHATSCGIMRHPGSVLEDIFEFGIFSSSLMPRLSRLSIIVISDGLFTSTNNLNIFRIKSIAVSFVSLGAENTSPDACFGYTPYVDLMRFTAKTTLGVYLTHQDLINSSQSMSKNKCVNLLNNPLHKLFCWTIHSETSDDTLCYTPRATNFRSFDTTVDAVEVSSEHVARFFCVDRPLDALHFSSDVANSNVNAYSHNYHDWRSFKQLDRSLDADFEQVLSCLLREGYLIKSIQFKHKETSKIVARLILHWRHNLDIEQELTAPYWSSTDPFDLGDNNQLMLRPFNAPLYGDTYCELFVHGSYSFLHNLYCDGKTKKKSEYRYIAYRQFRQLIDSVLQTHERLQYMSRFYRDSSLSKIPSFLQHGNSLLYEQPHTRKLTSTIENVLDERKTNEFQEYWQKISCLDTKSWKNLMHIHTLRLVLEHDQPKHKNVHYQNANGRYTHVQCRRALSAISTFIKSYASFALLEDTTYIKFIYNKDDDLREIETSATKGFIVIRINRLLPIIVVYLMFTSGILDSHRVQIVNYLEDQLTKCKLRNVRSSNAQSDNILKSKTISPSSESCCILIKSPLERMLKVYSRNFVNDFLIHNWSHGLPGSCPYSINQSTKLGNDNASQQKARSELMRDHLEGYNPESSINHFNLVFGKYLYGVRVVHTINNLPHDIVSSLASNVLSKISAILVNIRIKQGFHIAFNNSGILNLVVELAMRDHSHEDHASSCLCQYVVFPPTVTNCAPQTVPNVLGNHATSGVNSKPGSLTGSLANSDGFMKNAQDSNPHVRSDTGEIKIIKEYWIEQQYGVSSDSNSYHKSLEDMRYSEVVDHLYLTDLATFECLLTYDLLQLWCDKLSLYHDLDSSFVKDNPTVLAQSPAVSANSSNLTDTVYASAPSLPSNLMDNGTKCGNLKAPLIELEYKFSIAKFLDYCQQANLNVLLFRDQSEFHEPSLEDFDLLLKNYDNDPPNQTPASKHDPSISIGNRPRKMSMNISDPDIDHPIREHRSSYQHDNAIHNTYTYMNPIYSPSLNHLFLETLHKRLKQIHDKELKLSSNDRRKLPVFLKRRMMLNEEDEEDAYDLDDSVFNNTDPSRVVSPATQEETSDLDEISSKSQVCCEEEDLIDWRCFLRKGNQENLMIVLIPATLSDVTKWLNFIHDSKAEGANNRLKHDPICPIFVFRCSSTMINDHVLSFLKCDQKLPPKSHLESDLTLHFGQPCNYMGQLRTYNDEINNEILPLICENVSAQTNSDEKTLEVVHFRAFLRKIKNTVLKSRFSSLNDAYLSELFVHKDDILYYINNVDMDTQKKYHVSTQLRSLSDFIKGYEEFNDSLPTEQSKPYNKLLNSILLQKCGLFINQPIARFDESNPLMKQLHDKKLLFLMRCNYKIELPILEENLAASTLLKNFIKPSNNLTAHSTAAAPIALSRSINESVLSNSIATSSLGKTEGLRFMEMKCGSVGAAGSPGTSFSERHKLLHQTPRLGSNSTPSSLPNSVHDSYILEAFRGSKSCSIKEITSSVLRTGSDISLRHEAHMAEVLRRTGEREESHHYRRVLKSKRNYNQSHSAIDQALKRVDSLGRLEHFCLTPLLFSPSWRSKLAPVRDHTIESSRPRELDSHQKSETAGEAALSNEQQLQQEADERWHQLVCNNYIKEYEQYIQTLGFNSVQIKYPSAGKSASTQQNTTTASSYSTKKTSLHSSGLHSLTKQSLNSNTTPLQLRKGSLSTSTASLLAASNASTYNTGYLIKFLNSGCLVFKVGFCKPYVYSILYSIEGERFNNSNMKLNMTAFLDELDNIKVTMHLHSFTYDYHLRSMYSYISGRQLTFSHGYHLISFLDDFRKYYQKAPNYARNHILCGEVTISNIKVSGQQLYNYVVTHNKIYNMEVLEMSSFCSNLLTRNFMDDQKVVEGELEKNLKDASQELNPTVPRSHANDYVLIELKREKVRYRDGKDPDVFDCGLLITHDTHQAASSNNSLTLKYFFLLTNQRDLYPKLIHTYDNIISLGCHRPIRLGVAQLKQSAQPVDKANSVVAPSSGQSDPEDVQSSELQSSGEVSGPTSILSTANSVHSSTSGLQFGFSGSDKGQQVPDRTSLKAQKPYPAIETKIEAEKSEEAVNAPRSSLESSLNMDVNRLSAVNRDQSLLGSSLEEGSIAGGSSELKRNRKNSTGSSKKNATGNNQERTICDEEITYLGYFSSDEMDMLKFLQEKTANLRMHIEQVVRMAEVHYRRDYLWQKLMQRNTSSNKSSSDELPLTVDELSQLLSIVETIDLATLDPQLSTFTAQHVNWYLKLFKAFCDLKQSSMNQHEIYTVKTNRHLVLYVDPKCTTAFILLTIDVEKSFIELNMLLKDRHQCSKSNEKANQLKAGEEQSQSINFELDHDCHQLINDFVNFCATFMWSTLLV